MHKQINNLLVFLFCGIFVCLASCGGPGRAVAVFPDPDNPNRQLRCVVPGDEFIVKQGNVKASASVKNLGEVLKAEGSASRAVERIRKEDPQLQKTEVLLYYACVSRAQNMISHEKYEQLVDHAVGGQ